MKRSRKLKLTLMSAAPLALSACGGSRNPENLVYERLSDCHNDTRVTRTTCNEAYNRALSEHARTAPRFMTLDACQLKYGVDKCDQSLNGGTSSYTPRMSGFMVGRFTPAARNWYGSSYGPSTIITGGSWTPRPLYRTSDDMNSGSWSTGEGKSWGGSKEATKGTISTSSLNRGGFGGTSSARSSWGG